MVGSDEMSFEKWFLFSDTLVFWGLYEMPCFFQPIYGISRKQQANPPPPELEVSIGGGEFSFKKIACKYGFELHIKLQRFDFLYIFVPRFFSSTSYDPYAISFTNWKH